VPGQDTALAVIAMLLMGGGAILGVSLAFLAVGRSEDRERAAQAAARGSDPPHRAGPPRRRDHG
jgi:hypothetical protein